MRRDGRCSVLRQPCVDVRLVRRRLDERIARRRSRQGCSLRWVHHDWNRVIVGILPCDSRRLLADRVSRPRCARESMVVD